MALDDAAGRLSDRLFASAFSIGLAWTPYWLGGAWRFPWGVNALVFPGLTLSYEITRLAARRASPLPARELALPLALFLAVLLWIVVQMSALGAAPVIPALGARTPASISVDPGASAIAMVRLITDACAFWLAAQLGRDGALCLALLGAVAMIATLYGGYGLFLAAAYDNAIPGFALADGGGEVRSTFVNRNTFAAFAGLGLLANLALVARVERKRAGATRLLAALEALGRRGGWIAASLVVLAALVGSASRGGILSTTVGVLVLFGLLSERRRRRREGRMDLLVAVLALALAFLVFAGPIAGRLAELGLSDDRRLEVYRIVARAALERPISGFGYGAFAETFPLYRNASLSPVGVWEMAHNAYLELALGLGLAFAAALVIALAILAMRCLSGALDRGRGAEAPLIAVSASALIAVNALVDYSVQVESVTLVFMTLLGLGVAQSHKPEPSGAASC